MRRISILTENGTLVEWRCASASYGPESINVLMRKANRSDQLEERAKDFILVPLRNAVSMTEDEW